MRTVTTRRRVRADDLVFRAIDSSPVPGSAGPTIVLVHGIGMSHRYLSRLHRELSAHARVVSVDLPGFGGLPTPSTEVDIARMAAALAAVLHRIDAGPAVLVGHSMGAQWVIEAAARRPASVVSVVAIGPVVDPDHRTVFSQAVALGLDTLCESPLVNAIVFGDYVRCGVPWYLRQLHHMLAYPIEERMGELDLPVLIVRGARDPVAGREWCRRLRDRAPAALLVEIPRRHHLVQHSSPRAVAAAIIHHRGALSRAAPRPSDR